MKIPVSNWYYLLSYATHFPLKEEMARVHQANFPHASALLCQLLIRLTDKLLRQGVTYRHIDRNGPVNGVKGKLKLSQTIQKQLLPKGKTYCQYSIIDCNSGFYQILVATLRQLSLHPDIDLHTKDQLKRLRSRWVGVAEVKLNPILFRSQRVQGLSRLHRVILQLCEWIYHAFGFKTTEGVTPFYQLPDDAHLLAYVFESFIRNFYKKQLLGHARVGREHIQWAMDNQSPGDSYCPRMETDVSIVFGDRKYIIEAKYYAQALTQHYRGQKAVYHSSHLYQIFAYLKNMAQKDHMSRSCSGILLYPQVDEKLDDLLILSGHTVHIYTLDLSQDWRGIHKDLMSLITEEKVC